MHDARARKQTKDVERSLRVWWSCERTVQRPDHSDSILVFADLAQARTIGEAFEKNDRAQRNAARRREGNERREIDADRIFVRDAAIRATRKREADRGRARPFADSDGTSIRNQLVRRGVVAAV